MGQSKEYVGTVCVHSRANLLYGRRRHFVTVAEKVYYNEQKEEWLSKLNNMRLKE